MDCSYIEMVKRHTFDLFQPGGLKNWDLKAEIK
jgi:hypothetical protein